MLRNNIVGDESQLRTNTGVDSGRVRQQPVARASYLSAPCAQRQRSPSPLFEVDDLTGKIVQQSKFAEGMGGFADVYKALWGSEYVAVKVLRSQSTEEGDRRKKEKRLRRELRVWARLEHRNILPLYGVTSDFGLYTSMVCPWLEYGNLNVYLERHGDELKPSERFNFLCGVADGLGYLHSRNVVHGDLTGSNILINAEGKPCLCDFGLSKILAEFEGTSYFTNTRGAVRWAARELYQIHDDGCIPIISKECDIYSFGSVMLQMLSGQIPYHYIKRDATVVIELHYGRIPKRPSQIWINNKVWAFISTCWAESSQRPIIGTVSEFVQYCRAKFAAQEEICRPAIDIPTSGSAQIQINVSVVDDTLIHPVSSLTHLRNMYELKSGFVEQIDWLVDNGFDHVRHTIGDGDSFYRSVGFAFIEQVLHSSNKEQEVGRAVTTLQFTGTFLELAGFQRSFFGDLLKIMLSIVQQIIRPDLNGEKMNPDILLEAFQSPEVSNSVVLYLRLLTAAQIRVDPDSYAPFLIDIMMEPFGFCEAYVQEMGVDADDIQIAALSRVLGLTIDVGRIESWKVGSKGVEFVTFSNATARNARITHDQPIVLLRRPEHFELLYSSQ